MAEEAILGFLQNNEQITDSGQFSAEFNLDHNEVVNVIKSLHGFRYIDVQVLALPRSTGVFVVLNLVSDSMRVSSLARFGLRIMINSIGFGLWILCVRLRRFNTWLRVTK